MSERTDQPTDPFIDGVLLQGVDDKKPFLVKRWSGDIWVFYKHSDGQWVIARKATENDIEQAKNSEQIQRARYERTDQPKMSCPHCYDGGCEECDPRNNPKTVEEWAFDCHAKTCDCDGGVEGCGIYTEIRHALTAVDKAAYDRGISKWSDEFNEKIKAAEERGMEVERTRIGARRFIASKALEAVDTIANKTRDAIAAKVRALVEDTSWRVQWDNPGEAMDVAHAIADMIEKPE